MNRISRPTGGMTPVCLALAALCVCAGANAQQAAQPAATPRRAVGRSARHHPAANLARDSGAGCRRQDQLQPTEQPVHRPGRGDPHDIPQSITVINQALMQSQGSTSLASALRNVPGLTIGGAEGGQIGTNINLNGFSARTDIYLDGARDRAQYYRDVFALDAVRSADGPVVDAVRPRLDGRRDQPGHQAAFAHRGGRGIGLGQHHWAGPHHRRHQPAAVGHLGVPRLRDGAGRRCHHPATRPSCRMRASRPS